MRAYNLCFSPIVAKVQTVYSYAEARERLAVLLERALTEGQVRLRSRDGRVFIIRPERLEKTSPFEVRSVKTTDFEK